MAVVILALGIKSANGLVKSTINTANSLVEAGVDVSIVSIVGNHGGFDLLDPAFPLNTKVKKYTLDGIPFSDSSISKDELEEVFHEENQKYLKIAFTNRHAFRLQHIDEQLTEDDLLICVHPLALVLYLKANPSTKAKTLIQVHGNYLEETDNFNLLKDYADRVDYIQTVSSYMKDDLIELLDVKKDKIQCIYNITKPISISKNHHKYLKRISIIGSIQERKNQLDAIRMLSLIDNKNVILQIYGNPLGKEYASLLREQIQNLGLNGRVFFMDVASEKEIYENTDIAIMPSLHEGFGYIFLESALYGIPIVAYDFKYGAKEFSDNNKNGCLVDLGDYRRMASIVEELLYDKEKYERVIKYNKDKFEREYSEEQIVSKYLELIGNKHNVIDLNHVANDMSNNEFVPQSNIQYSYKEIDVIPPYESENKNPKKVKKFFHQIVFDVKEDVKDLIFFYRYKKVRFPVDFEVFDSENNEFVKLADLDSINTLSNKTLLIKIPSKNRLSLGNEANNLELYVKKNTDPKEYLLLNIAKKAIHTNYEEGFYKFSYKLLGEQDIDDVPHILNLTGMWIKYPSFEAINSIENEKAELLEYETKNIRFYGETFPFFKIKKGNYQTLKINMNSGRSLSINFQKVGSYKDVFLKIQQLEEKYQLFDLTISGVYFWELIRASIFEHILEAVGLFSSHFSKQTKKLYKYSGVKQLSQLPKAEKLIFEFPRKGAEIDYRTVAVQKHFIDNSNVIEYPQDKGYSDAVLDKDSNHFAIEEFLKFCEQNKLSLSLNAEDKTIIKWLKTIFIKHLGLDIEFSVFVNQRLLKFNQEFAYFDDFFKNNDYNEVMIPSSYWSAGIAHAARVNSIIVSDIQYAAISKYHPSYAFPIAGRAYGADRIYRWSKYWIMKESPFNRSVIIDNNYFIEKYKSLGLNLVNNEKYDVAFVSQSRIGAVFFDWILNFSLTNTDMSIVYCPHPDEDVTAYNNYSDLLRLKNIEISENETLLEVAHAKNVVGVYSTTLFEALALGKSVYVAKIQGYEVVEREISNGYMNLVDTVEELNKAIHKLRDSDAPQVNFRRLLYNFNEDNE